MQGYSRIYRKRKKCHLYCRAGSVVSQFSVIMCYSIVAKIRLNGARKYAQVRVLTGISRRFGFLLPFCIIFFTKYAGERIAPREITRCQNIRPSSGSAGFFTRSPNFLVAILCFSLLLQDVKTRLLKRQSKNLIEKRKRGQNLSFTLIRFRRIFLHYMQKKTRI